MKWTWLESDLQPLPAVENADAEGLLALGGQLSESRLEEAYRKGIYPWYSEDTPVMWWSPDPRMVLFPEELHIPRSMRPLISKNAFQITIDQAFDEVINRCAGAERPGQEGTWIVDELKEAYRRWHYSGRVHSFEAWQEGKLVGGLYGVCIGRAFFGESMYTSVPDASKYAFIKAVEWMRKSGIRIIDCQMETDHLRRFGAKLIPRETFIAHLSEAVDAEEPVWCKGPISE